MTKMKGFKWVQTILSIIIMPIGFVIWGLAASPGVLLFLEMSNMTVDWVNWQRAIVLGITLGIGALLWCIIDLIIVGIFGMVIRPKLDDAREPTESMLTIRWGVFSVFHRLAQPSLKLSLIHI